MATNKEQGRYARMVAFWALTLLMAHGCLGLPGGGGLPVFLDRVLPDSFNPTLVDQFPLLGSLKVSTLIAFAALGLSAWAIHRLITRPKAVQLLTDTEAEMRKVTWPSMSETWAGTLAVMLTVVVLFVFLAFADFVFTESASKLMGVR